MPAATACSASPRLTQTGHERLNLCKHTTAPSSSSSKTSQLSFHQHHIHPDDHQKPGEQPKTSDMPRQPERRRYSGFNSYSSQRAEVVITFASLGFKPFWANTPEQPDTQLLPAAAELPGQAMGMGRHTRISMQAASTHSPPSFPEKENPAGVPYFLPATSPGGCS